MIGYRALTSAALSGAVAAFVSFSERAALAENVLSDQCIQFTCKESLKKCTAGGAMSAVTVSANTAIQGCPSEVTVWYEGKSSVTPFSYYSCGCRPPAVTKITK
jgi:hypothetical protein